MLPARNTANRHALRCLARHGAGSFEFFDHKAKSRWEAKISALLEKASQPSLSCIEVEWQRFNDAKDEDDSSPKLTQAPANIMALFNGCRLVVYGFVPNCTQVCLVTVKFLLLVLVLPPLLLIPPQPLTTHHHHYYHHNHPPPPLLPLPPPPLSPTATTPCGLQHPCPLQLLLAQVGSHPLIETAVSEKW